MYSINRFSPFFGLLSFLFAPLCLSFVDGGDGGGGGGGGDGGGSGGGDGGSGGGDGKGAAADTLLSKGGGGGDGTPPGDGKGTPPGDGKGTPPGDGKGTPPPGTGAGDPWFVGLWDKTGKIDKAKFDSLPDHLKPHKDLFAKYETAEAFMVSLVHHQQLASKKGLAPLPTNASPEMKAERQALMRQLNGVPEKPEGYGIAKPKDMPDEHWNQEYVGGVMGILHKHNASPELVKELTAYDLEAAGKVRGGYDTQQQTRLANEGKALKEAFGNDYDSKIDLAQRAARTAGIDLQDPEVGNNSKVIIALAKLGAMISEDKLVSGDGGDSGKGGQSDREKAKDIVKNPANPLYKAYHDPQDSEHQAAVDTVTRFNTAAVRKKK
jgi:hypothetical protein